MTGDSMHLRKAVLNKKGRAFLIGLRKRTHVLGALGANHPNSEKLPGSAAQ